MAAINMQISQIDLVPKEITDYLTSLTEMILVDVKVGLMLLSNIYSFFLVYLLDHPPSYKTLSEE